VPSDPPEVLRPSPAWAHRTGVLQLRSEAERSISPPLDPRSALQEVIHRYCWAFDERRADLLRECFTEDGTWEASVMGETRVGPFVGQGQVQEWLSRFWDHQRDQRRHLILNFVVEDLSEDRATALAYLLLMGSSGAASRMESVGFYRLDFRSDAGTWRIKSLVAGFDSPFWTMDVSEMSPRVRQLFGILDAPSEA